MFNFEFHQSQIGMFQKCEKQFYYRYLEGMVKPPSGALTLGSSVDDAVTHDLANKIKTGELANKQEVLDVYSSTFEKRRDQTDWESDDPGSVKDIGYNLVSLHHDKVGPVINPETVQESFKIETDEGYSLAGTMDITTKEGWVRDTKTSKMKYAEDAVEGSLQATMYTYAYKVKKGKEPKGFVFDVLTKTKVPAYQEVKGQVLKSNTNVMFETINIMKNRITRGEFSYAPEGAWYCSAKWCAYYGKECPRGRK